MILSFLSTLLTQDTTTNNPLGGDKEITGPAGPLNPDTSLVGAAVGGAPLEKFFSVMLGFFTVIGGLMFLTYFLFAALSWITGGGEKGKVETAKTQMTNAAIGLSIVLVAHAIIGIVGAVLGLDILQPVEVLSRLWK